MAGTQFCVPACRYQNFPLRPPWDTPEEDRWVDEPELLWGFG